VPVLCAAHAGAGGGEEPPPGELDSIVFIDWRTRSVGATDTTSIQDGKFVDSYDNSAPSGLTEDIPMSIVAGQALGFPTLRAMQVRGTHNNQAFGRVCYSSLGTLDVGEWLYQRIYYRHAWPFYSADPDSDQSMHPIESDQTGGLDWAFTVELNSLDDWYCDFQTLSNGTSSRWRAALLDTGEVYRFEWAIHKVGAETYNFHVRVYDADDNLIAGDANYSNAVLGGSTNLSTNPVLTFDSAGGVNCGTIRLGNNGVGWPGQFDEPPNLVPDWDTDSIFCQQAGYAARFDTDSNGWCGAYGNIEGEVLP
jgi:hypothetical protein